MVRADRVEWAQRVQRWQDSGLTAKEFGAEIGVSHTSLSFWKWRLKKDQAAGTEPSPRPRVKRSRRTAVKFVEVADQIDDASASASQHIELVVGARYVLRVARGFDGATLQQLLDVLESRS
jgi:transposase